MRRLLLAAGLFASLAVFPMLAAPEPMAQRLARFNQLLAREPWRQEPVLIALLWVGPALGSDRSIVYKAGPGENPQKASVVITEDGLRDDSLAGSRVSFSFTRVRGQWALTAVSEAWKCRRGPNTKGYMPGVCP
ncbi:MAG: hypothetical protein ACAI44_07830 [Candidatus Sericytochromatia bacterium]